MKTIHTIRAILATTAAAFVVLPTWAAGTDSGKTATGASATAPANTLAYSDRERMTLWTDEKQRLESALATGHNKADYLKMLSDSGYTVTSINADKKDYLEYEVVKNANSYEVQIKLDKAGKGESVKVESNIWRADTTKNVLRGNRMEQPPRYMASNSAYSDSPRMARWNTETEKLEKALAEGKPLAAYTAELKKMGYQITSTNDRDKDYVEMEVVKGQSTYEVQIDLDESGKASKVDVTANMWQSDETEKALEKNRR